MKDFLSILFRPNEETCFTQNPHGTSVFPISQLLRYGAGVNKFFSINPLLGDRRDSNVQAFRTILLECDKMAQEEQLAYIRGLGMPWTACVDSGGKSVHFLICLEKDLQNESDYRNLVARIHRVVEKADHTTKNPSRLSRLPGVFRDETGKEQKLIALRGKVSLDCLEAWLGGFPESEKVSAEPVSEGQLSTQTLHLVFNGVGPTPGRNHRLFMAACEFYRAGYSVEKASEYLKQGFDFHGKDFDFTRAEFDATIKSAYTRAEFDALERD